MLTAVRGHLNRSCAFILKPLILVLRAVLLNSLFVYNISEFIFEPEKCYRKLLASKKWDIYMFIMGWTVWSLSPGGCEIFCTHPDWPWGHPASCIMGTGAFPGVKQPGVVLTTHPHLAPRLKKEWSCTSTLPLGPHGLL